MDQRDQGQTDKREQIDNFLSILDDHISNKVDDATSDCNDSCTGFSTYDSASKLEKALYELFDIEVEE